MSAGPALVVLAAGASSRLGEPKALARLREGPAGTALELLLAAGAELSRACAGARERSLVVAGRDHAALRALVPAEVEVVQNERWSAGRTQSVLCAMQARPGRDLCIAPVDVPLVPGEVFAALAAEWARQGSPARGWLAPCIESCTSARGSTRTFGHPVVIGRALLPELKELPTERPLSALRARAAPLLALVVESAAILDDLDSPADLARLRERLAGG